MAFTTVLPLIRIFRANGTRRMPLILRRRLGGHADGDRQMTGRRWLVSNVRRDTPSYKIA
jgi:hypothetical protein